MFHGTATALCDPPPLLFQANLAKQEGRLAVANAELGKAQALLDEKQAELDKVQAKFDAAMNEKMVRSNVHN
jgi:dynein heavy chain